MEPIAGVLGAGAIVAAEPLLPYALAFAAGMEGKRERQRDRGKEREIDG